MLQGLSATAEVSIEILRINGRRRNTPFFSPNNLSAASKCGAQNTSTTLHQQTALDTMTNEKEALLESAPIPHLDREGKRGRPRGTLRLHLCVIGLVAVILLNWRHTSKSLFQYPGEHITWSPCGSVGDRPVECSTITVPLDHFNASNNAGGKHFSVPLIRLRGKNATHNLLLNPGGPGGSGAEFIHRRGAQLSAIVGEGFHLLSFDPRGINGSKPSASCYPNDDARRNIPKPVQPRNAFTDSGDLWAWASGFSQACADTMGEYAPHINTPQTAADMNNILEAVGQDDMYYWGFSYGTVLGQTYATLFPERSKRVIIDGVVNHFNWYNASSDESMIDTDSVYDGFISECIKAGPEACPLASQEIAETKSQLSKRLISTIQKLIDDPISVYINATQYGTVTYSSIWHGAIFPALYRPANWSTLANNLASLLHGNATPAFLTYAWTDYHAESESNFGEANTFVELNDATSGPAHWPQDRLALLRASAGKLNVSMFSETVLDGIFLTAKWPVPPGHGFVPKRHVQTAHPVLVLSSAHDPITPLVSAQVANGVFAGSRLVKVLGYGHCSIAVPSVCLARHVRGFLYEGKLPESNEECEVDGNPYFGKGGEEGEMRVFEDEEERAIHRAQVELARDIWFRPRRRLWI